MKKKYDLEKKNEEKEINLFLLDSTIHIIESFIKKKLSKKAKYIIKESCGNIE